MTTCQFCESATGHVPYQCSYCGLTVCKQHRFPENHDCSRLPEATTLGPEFRGLDDAPPARSADGDPGLLGWLLFPIYLVALLIKWVVTSPFGWFLLLVLITMGIGKYTNLIGVY